MHVVNADQQHVGIGACSAAATTGAPSTPVATAVIVGIFMSRFIG
jgi:hypothetical protein